MGAGVGEAELGLGGLRLLDLERGAVLREQRPLLVGEERLDRVHLSLDEGEHTVLVRRLLPRRLRVGDRLRRGGGGGAGEGEGEGVRCPVSGVRCPVSGEG